MLASVAQLLLAAIAGAIGAIVVLLVHRVLLRRGAARSFERLIAESRVDRSRRSPPPGTRDPESVAS